MRVLYRSAERDLVKTRPERHGAEVASDLVDGTPLLVNQVRDRDLFRFGVSIPEPPPRVGLRERGLPPTTGRPNGPHLKGVLTVSAAYRSHIGGMDTSTTTEGGAA